MNWRIELSLRFRGMPFKVKVGFCFEWKAWLIAYDHFNVGPEEFGNLDPDKQMTALAFGSACWDRIKRGKNIFFNYEDIVHALNKASKEENLKLAETLKNAKFPEWLSKGLSETDKKKVNPE